MEHDINSQTFGGSGGPVVIHDWAYIGTRVTILPGITIGEGAVVASGAVVTKDVAPWTMVGGIPAKFIRNRPTVKYTLNTKSRAYFQ
jgi:maltose O-acetyltransferase